MKQGQNKMREENSLRKSRIEDIQYFIRKHVDRPISSAEIASIKRLNNQTLHLLSAAIIESGRETK